MTEVVEPITYISVVAFLVFAILGFHSSVRLTKLYRSAKDQIEERNRPVLYIIVVASWLITGAAFWIGGLSVIRLLTQSSFPWTPPITLLIAITIVAIPVFFERALARVARERPKRKE